MDTTRGIKKMIHKRRCSAPKRDVALKSQIENSRLGIRVGLGDDCTSVKAGRRQIAPLIIGLKISGFDKISNRTIQLLEKMQKRSRTFTQDANIEADGDGDRDRGGLLTMVDSCTARIEKLEKANARLNFFEIQEHELCSVENDVELIKLTNKEEPQKSLEEQTNQHGLYNR